MLGDNRDTLFAHERRPAGPPSDCTRLFQRKLVVFSSLDQPLNIASTHELADQVGLVLLLTNVEKTNDVGMIAQSAHRLGLALDSGQSLGVQAIRLDQR